jgi:thiamine-phosphate pyrophosphorylase
MVLPRLLLIADGFTDPVIAEKVCSAVGAGVRWVQLRDHAATDPLFETAAMDVLRRVTEENPGARVTVNARIKVAQNLHLSFHTGRRGPDPLTCRSMLGAEHLIGASVHSERELEAALAADCQYVLFSPIFQTATHPEAQPIGVEALGRMSEMAGEMRVLALGGITPQRAARCLSAGAYGVAVHAAILSAPDIGRAVSDFNQVIPGL